MVCSCAGAGAGACVAAVSLWQCRLGPQDEEPALDVSGSSRMADGRPGTLLHACCAGVRPVARRDQVARPLIVSVAAPADAPAVTADSYQTSVVQAGHPIAS